MPIPVFPPARENDLAAWSAQFSTLISGSPVTYGLTASQATAFSALESTWAMRYAAVINPSSNSKTAVIAKNEAKEAMLNGAGGAWELVNIIQAFPGTTDAMRGELGLRIPATGTVPVPPPSDPPLLSIMSCSERTMTIRLRDKTNSEGRAKPAGVQGATVLYYVGENTPADPSEWKFLLNESRTQFEADIPPVVPAGEKFWVTAFWFNARKQSSPVASPESVRVDDGLGNEMSEAA